MNPLVLANDDGIRPAGRPDACFYCRQSVGEPHGAECVAVRKRVEHRVHVTLPDGTKVKGLWQFNEPHFWDAHMSEFHKNGSTWCANNFLQARDGNDGATVTWDDGADPWPILFEADHEISKPCLCFSMSFRTEFVRVVDPTPRTRAA